jgi:sortase (surface protein transpeptidase)
MEAPVLKRSASRITREKSLTRNRQALQRQRSYVEYQAVTKIVFRIGYAFCVLFLFYYALTSVVQDPGLIVSTAVQAKEQAPRTGSGVGSPIRLKIPKIKVNAVVRPVGLAADGSMGVPKHPQDTAWYSLGAKPGEAGSAVIAGHVNWWYGATGVFAKLHILKPGDLITVQDAKGKDVSFVVRGSKEYSLDDDASEVFLGRDGKSHLNLVTCSGIWDRLTQKYTKRLVVFADEVVKN